MPVTTLRAAVERVAHDPAYRERVQHIQQITRQAGSYQLAAEAIMRFTEEHPRARQA